MTLQLRPTFSESWYRVANLRAKLRASAQISRQFYRGERWYVVRDPAGNQFHRLSDPAYRFVALLDGSRTVEDAWELCGGVLEDDAPTQPEVIQILSHLYSANLIDADVTPDATVLLRRHKQLTKRKMQNRMMNMLFPRIPLWDPDKFLKRWMPVNNFIFSRLGVIIWLLVVISAVAMVLPHWNDPSHSLQKAAQSSVDIRSNPINLVLLYGVFVLIKFIHELGHAFACRRFGGECHEMGIMFLVFIPTPYVDASTAWAFPNKWHRIFVGAAGMIVELFFAAICACIWMLAGDIHSIVAQLAFNAMLIASVTTLIFNANPLLRYDGYYILSDFLEIPNLRQKSTEYALGLIKRHIFKVKLQHPLPPPLQRFWLFTYAVSSSIYRAFVGLVILLIVAYEIPVLGPLMAISGVLTWFMVPLFKTFKYLATDAELHRKRPIAFAFSGGVLAALVIVIGIIRFPLNVDAEGVLSVDPADSRHIYADEPGFIRQIGNRADGKPLADGDWVHKGQIIMVLENKPLQTQMEVLDAQIGQIKAEEMQALPTSPVLAQSKEMELKTTYEQKTQLQQRIDRLTVRAPIDGELIAPNIQSRLGQFVGRDNKEIFRVEDVNNQYVEAVLPQSDFQLLYQHVGNLASRTQVRMVGEISHTVNSEAVKLVDTATKKAPSAALTQMGGGDGQLDPTERTEANYLVSQFQAHVILDDVGSYITGQRAYVRFKLDKRPLLWQWTRKFWQLIESKGESAKWIEEMTEIAAKELWSVFDARRVKMPELKGLDALANGVYGWVKNRRPVLANLRAQAKRIDRLEPEIQKLGSTAFAEAVAECRDLARLDRLEGAPLERGLALAREASVRTLGLRPFVVQLMGALAMIEQSVAEMATGEGKTLTAALAASIWAWSGRAVHIITVNDYLVGRDAEEMGPIYRMMGLKVGHVVHETTPQERIDHYRRDIIYCTSKELVADFLRDQIRLGNLRTSTQTSVGMMLGGNAAGRLMLPGLFRTIVDEADSLLIDEAVTPLIISNSPDDEANAVHYRAADELCQRLDYNRDFTIDRTVRTVDLTTRGQTRLEELCEGDNFWRGKRRREELVTQALVGRHCFIRDEQYLVTEDSKVQIIDESTGRIMHDRSWRHGLHQAIEVKEGVPVTADKENLARLSFQRFFRQYPYMAGMTGTAWEASPELWQIYQRAVIRIPTNRPCLRQVLPIRMFDTMDQKWNAVVERVAELHAKGLPILIGTRSVLASEEVSRRLSARQTAHRVLNATQTAQEASIVAEAGQRGQITVATNMAGRGTDIKLAKNIAELGGLHVIATEPHGSFRVDRQLFGRAARQGDPGSAQMFASAEDDLFIRHAASIRRFWRSIGPWKLIKFAQARAEHLARFNRKQVLKSDDWMDQSLPF